MSDRTIEINVYPDGKELSQTMSLEDVKKVELYINFDPFDVHYSKENGVLQLKVYNFDVFPERTKESESAALNVSDLELPL